MVGSDCARRTVGVADAGAGLSGVGLGAASAVSSDRVATFELTLGCADISGADAVVAVVSGSDSTPVETAGSGVASGAAAETSVRAGDEGARGGVQSSRKVKTADGAGGGG